MATDKEIHDFAVKYHNLYSSPKTTEQEVRVGFAEKCFALGFEMDCGHSFDEAYPGVGLGNAEKFDQIVDSITDAHFLGTAIFSYWRYITHWAMSGEDDLLSIDNRKWFILAFVRLATITDEKKESPFVFEGTLQRVRLISNNICYGPEPFPDDEVEQRLSITSGRGIWLTRYRYGGIDDRPRLLGKEKIAADEKTIRNILDVVARNFEEYDNIFATDVGSWQAELTNTEGKTITITGSLISESFPGLSDFIREQLGRNDLFLFDGNPDRVDRIEVYLDRHTEIKMAKPIDQDHQYALWNYHEELKIDRATESVEHFRQIFEQCDVRNVWHVEEGVSNFLDDLDPDVLSDVEGNPPDVYVDPHKSDSYKIEVTTKLGGTRETTGTFDKNGLPKDWPEFADQLYDFLTFYGIGDFFDKRIYGKLRRRINDLIFCNVVFENGGKEYYYQADEDFDVGDLVIVPAGEDNHEAVVRIESVEYHPAEEAPFPLNKIKHVIRKFDEDKDKALLQQD